MDSISLINKEVIKYFKGEKVVFKEVKEWIANTNFFKLEKQKIFLQYLWKFFKK